MFFVNIPVMRYANTEEIPSFVFLFFFIGLSGVEIVFGKLLQFFIAPWVYATWKELTDGEKILECKSVPVIRMW